MANGSDGKGKTPSERSKSVGKVVSSFNERKAQKEEASMTPAQRSEAILNALMQDTGRMSRVLNMATTRLEVVIRALYKANVITDEMLESAHNDVVGFRNELERIFQSDMRMTDRIAAMKSWNETGGLRIYPRDLGIDQWLINDEDVSLDERISLAEELDLPEVLELLSQQKSNLAESKLEGTDPTDGVQT